jgi:hypothetical protein
MTDQQTRVSHCSYCEKPLTGPPEYGSFCGEGCAVDSNIDDGMKLTNSGLANLFSEVSGEPYQALGCPACLSIDSTYFEKVETVRDEGFFVRFSCGDCSAIFELAFLCDREALIKTKVKLLSTQPTKAER